MVSEGKKGKSEEEGVRKQTSGDSLVSLIMDPVNERCSLWAVFPTHTHTHTHTHIIIILLFSLFVNVVKTLQQLFAIYLVCCHGYIVASLTISAVT